MEKELVCIQCPLGCRLTILMEDGVAKRIEGNECVKGKKYAAQEAVEPRRTITSLMRASNRTEPFSVRTTGDIPKEKLWDCVNLIRTTRPAAPIKPYDVIIGNICGTGVDVVATQGLN